MLERRLGVEFTALPTFGARFKSILSLTLMTALSGVSIACLMQRLIVGMRGVDPAYMSAIYNQNLGDQRDSR